MLLSAKIDNDNGTINWRRRAKLCVVLSKIGGMTKRQTLAQLKKNPTMTKLVTQYWDKVGKKRKNANKTR